MRNQVNGLFAADQTSFKAKLQSAVQRLAASNIFIGTSSWKYPGWTGQIYDEQRYHYRGKFAETRFERDCLTEYAETFKTVCVDAAYYQFPSAKYLTGLVQKVPDDFLFTFKVTDDITLKRFTNAAACLRRPSARMSSRGIKSKKFALRPCCHRSKTEDVSSRLGTTKLSSRLWRTGYHGRARNPRARSSFAPAS